MAIHFGELYSWTYLKNQWDWKIVRLVFQYMVEIEKGYPHLIFIASANTTRINIYLCFWPTVNFSNQKGYHAELNKSQLFDLLAPKGHFFEKQRTVTVCNQQWHFLGIVHSESTFLNMCTYSDHFAKKPLNDKMVFQANFLF